MGPKQDDTREKLLEATYQLISEKGYMGATTKEIAARAGVSELTLFRKFGKKEILFEEMLESYTFLPRLIHLMDDVNEMPLAEGLNTIGIRFLQTLRDRRPLILIMFSEMAHYPEKVREIYKQMILNIGGIIVSYLEKMKLQGRIISNDTDFVAKSFLRTLVMTFMYESAILKQEMGDEKIEQTVSSLVEIFLHGVANRNEE